MVSYIYKYIHIPVLPALKKSYMSTIFFIQLTLPVSQYIITLPDIFAFTSSNSPILESPHFFLIRLSIMHLYVIKRGLRAKSVFVWHPVAGATERILNMPFILAKLKAKRTKRKPLR